MFEHDGTLDTYEHGHSLGALAGIRDSRLSWQAKAVAWALISRAQPVHEEGWVCWPSLGRIAKDCGHARSTVQKGLRMLRDAGLIEWSSGGTDDAGNRYNSRYVLDYRAMEALRRPKRR